MKSRTMTLAEAVAWRGENGEFSIVNIKGTAVGIDGDGRRYYLFEGGKAVRFMESFVGGGDTNLDRCRSRGWPASGRYPRA